ncbi:MAG: hypothetical protein WDW36_009969 [Sanguina aurantia]
MRNVMRHVMRRGCDKTRGCGQALAGGGAGGAASGCAQRSQARQPGENAAASWRPAHDTAWRAQPHLHPHRSLPACLCFEDRTGTMVVGGALNDADAATASRIGLLHASVSASDLDEAIERQLYLLAKAGPNAQREAKQLALRVGGNDVAQAERLDASNAELIARLRISEEGQHGLAAFLDKRAPRWVAAV